MWEKNFRFIRCPVCESPCRKTNKIFYKTKGKIVHGIVSCLCDSYPIIDGTLFLFKNTTKQRVLRFLEQYGSRLHGNSQIPIFLLSSRIGKAIPDSLVWLAAKYAIMEYINFPLLVFILFLLGFFDRQWAKYLIQRYKNMLFYPSAIASSLVQTNTRILDAGCGPGHLLALLKQKTSEDNLWAVDNRLVNLFLAKRFFSSSANYIYYDLSLPLPFTSSIFDFIFCADAFQYIANQRGFAKELERTLGNQGILILSHLHNVRFFPNTLEYSNTPHGFISFFSSLQGSIFSEKYSSLGVLTRTVGDAIKQLEKQEWSFTLVLKHKNTPLRLPSTIKIERVNEII